MEQINLRPLYCGGGCTGFQRMGKCLGPPLKERVPGSVVTTLFVLSPGRHPAAVQLQPQQPVLRRNGRAGRVRHVTRSDSSIVRIAVFELGCCCAESPL